MVHTVRMIVVRKVFFAVVLGGILLMGVTSHTLAQDPAKKVDETKLTMLLEASLVNASDSFLQKRINEEQENIRNLIEDELSILVTVPSDEEEIESSGEFSRAIERQRTIIRSLEERLRERKIDLDLLIAEEQRFYLDPGAASGALTEFRTTKSHPQLLARKTVLQERIAFLNILIPHQKDRLERLIADQRLQQFGVLIEFGKYFLIALGILLIERLIQNFLLVHISNQNIRYRVTKFFSGSVYVFLLLWLLGVLYTHNPGILASFAIVGAGVAIALQDVIKDVVGCLVIYQNDLFSQGDRISIGAKTGQVIDIGLLHTKVLEIGLPPEGVLEQTGKVLSIPNSKVLVEPVNNYNVTSDFVKAEIALVLSFESNAKKAEEILTSILQQSTDDFSERDRMQHAIRTRSMYVPYQPSSATVFKSIAADGVQFVLRFTVPIGMQRVIVSELTGKILEGFRTESDIELAYQTSRIIAEGSVH
ncbi:hypothetical protein COU76_02655 [Candidatus Peregrinibacteria bacterium CG10_big_fil_rev_8_21_14_0_10_49_10]|nr:MAG: hypothetical protein COU76_02655 [Candidatus Peregrinibacteria bacterium CG10_big_fil_rev_8_21_14_0_10_49_10]